MKIIFNVNENYFIFPLNLKNVILLIWNKFFTPLRLDEEYKKIEGMKKSILEERDYLIKKKK